MIQETIRFDEHTGELEISGTERVQPPVRLPPPTTKETILSVYDEMAEAIRSGEPYQTRLDPPPADPRVAHPESSRPAWAKRPRPAPSAVVKAPAPRAPSPPRKKAAPPPPPAPAPVQFPEAQREHIREQIWRPARAALRFIPSGSRERWQAAVQVLERLADGEAVPAAEVEQVSQGTLHTLGPAVRERDDGELLFCEVICDAAEVIHWAIRTVETRDQRDLVSLRIRVKKLAESLQEEWRECAQVTP